MPTAATRRRPPPPREIKRAETPGGEAHGEELAQLVIDAARRGDWRAAAFLYERVYGRPKELHAIELPETVEAVDKLSSAELEAFRKRVLRDFPQLRVVRAPSVPTDEETA
jgi:hypothetical protein